MLQLDSGPRLRLCIKFVACFFTLQNACYYRMAVVFFDSRNVQKSVTQII